MKTTEILDSNDDSLFEIRVGWHALRLGEGRGVCELVVHRRQCAIHFQLAPLFTSVPPGTRPLPINGPLNQASVDWDPIALDPNSTIDLQVSASPFVTEEKEVQDPKVRARVVAQGQVVAEEGKEAGITKNPLSLFETFGWRKIFNDGVVTPGTRALGKMAKDEIEDFVTTQLTDDFLKDAGIAQHAIDPSKSATGWTDYFKEGRSKMIEAGSTEFATQLKDRLGDDQILANVFLDPFQTPRFVKLKQDTKNTSEDGFMKLFRQANNPVEFLREHVVADIDSSSLLQGGANGALQRLKNNDYGWCVDNIKLKRFGLTTGTISGTWRGITYSGQLSAMMEGVPLQGNPDKVTLNADWLMSRGTATAFFGTFFSIGIGEPGNSAGLNAGFNY